MKIALVLNDDFSMWHFFRGLIGALVAREVHVYVVTPAGPYVAALRELGATHLAVEMSRFVHPVADMKLCWTLWRLFRREQIAVVCNITVKPNVYGAIAARLAGVRRVVGMVEGLGYAFVEGGGWKDRVVKHIVTKLYRVACALSDRVGFANPDDLAFFVGSGIIKSEKAVAFRSMSGVDLLTYSAGAVDTAIVQRLRDELGIKRSMKIVAMVTRIVWSKGVKEFVDASQEALGWSQPVTFVLVGPLDPGARDAVPEAYLRERTSPRFIWISGFRSELRELLYLADVVVLPSYYREGIPHVLLEAMGMGKPIVTTDNVGCREVVDEGKNGFLVPVKDFRAVAKAVKTLIEDDGLRIAFGRHSRRKVEAEFDEVRVVKKVLADLCGV